MTKRKKQWGDRQDGYWVRDLDAMHVIMPHVYNRRTGSEVFVVQEYDVSKLLKYIEKVNKQHPEYKTTMFQALLMGLGKIIYHRPLLNRFIAAGRTYQRYNIDLSFIVKKEFSDHSEEAMLRVSILPEMTLDSFSAFIDANVKKARSDSSSSTEDIMETLAKLPRPLLSLVIWVLKKLDQYGKLPRAIWDGDINYSTVLFTNLGSIKAPAVYHHLNEYGTASIIAAVGTLTKKPVFDDKGQFIGNRDVVEIGVTIDERIADGFYFAQSLKLLQKLLDKPELLNQKVEESIDE